MSGGGGGRIILSKVREIADLESVKLNISDRKRVRLLQILGKDESDLLPTEVDYLLHCIGAAYDKQRP